MLMLLSAMPYEDDALSTQSFLASSSQDLDLDLPSSWIDDCCADQNIMLPLIRIKVYMMMMEEKQGIAFSPDRSCPDFKHSTQVLMELSCQLLQSLEHVLSIATTSASACMQLALKTRLC